MTDNKFYVPDIEEFHVGFEYQYLRRCYAGVSDEDKSKLPWIWITRSLYSTTLTHFADDLIREAVRVKYLDFADIESLGFASQHLIDLREDELAYIDGFILDIEKNKDILLYLSDDNIIDIYERIMYNEATGNWSSRCLFSGTIKNKSELQVLLKQLGIV